jgi:hypothetical protein
VGILASFAFLGLLICTIRQQPGLRVPSVSLRFETGLPIGELTDRDFASTFHLYANQLLLPVMTLHSTNQPVANGSRQGNNPARGSPEKLQAQQTNRNGDASGIPDGAVHGVYRPDVVKGRSVGGPSEPTAVSSTSLRPSIAGQSMQQRRSFRADEPASPSPAYTSPSLHNSPNPEKQLRRPFVSSQLNGTYKQRVAMLRRQSREIIEHVERKW